MALSHAQQIERFGMTTEEAHAIRDKAMASGCDLNAARAFAFTAIGEADSEVHARLEAQGFTKEHNGGGTFIYRKGNVIVSGADGDLPSAHWYCVGIYADWSNSCDEPICSLADWSGVPGFEDMGGARNLWADIADAELMAERYSEAIADGQAHERAACDARFFTDHGTMADARAMMADNDKAGKPCPDLHAYCLEVLARGE